MKKMNEGVWDKIVSNIGTKKQRAAAWQRRVAAGEKKPKPGTVDQSSLVNTKGKADRLTKTVQNHSNGAVQPERGQAQGLAKQTRTGDISKGKSISDFRKDAQRGQYGKEVAKASVSGQAGKTAPSNRNSLAGANQAIAKRNDATVAHNRYAYKSGTDVARRQQQAASQGQAYQRTANANAAYNKNQAAQKSSTASSAAAAAKMRQGYEGRARDAAFKQGADKIRSTTNYSPSTGGQQHPPTITPAGGGSPTGAQGGAKPMPHPGQTAQASANAVKAAASRAAVPSSKVASALTKTPIGRSSGQTVRKGTSKAPIKNPAYKANFTGGFGQKAVSSAQIRTPNAAQKAAGRKKLFEELVYNIIESNETEPLKAKVADKVKKEKSKKNTDIGGKTDMIETDPKKPVMFGNQYR